MAVEKQSERFVHLISKRILSDERLSRKEQKLLFKQSVSSVKNGQLRDYLLKNYAYFRKLFLGYLERGNEGQPLQMTSTSDDHPAISPGADVPMVCNNTLEAMVASESIVKPEQSPTVVDDDADNTKCFTLLTERTPPFVYNLFNPSGKLSKHAIDAVDAEKKEKLYTEFLRQKLRQSSHVKPLYFTQWAEAVVQNIPKEWKPQTALYITEQSHKLLAGSCSLACLTNVMYFICGELQELIDPHIVNNSMKRCKRLCAPLRLHLNFFHMKYTSIKAEGDAADRSPYNYGDLMASLLCLYVDVLIVSHGSSVAASSIGSDLVGYVSSLLHDFPDRIYDMVRELRAVGSFSLVVPLVRKHVSATGTGGAVSAEVYSKLVLCVRRVAGECGQLADNVVQLARNVRAPKGYMHWLRELNASLVEHMPEDRKFKGRVVTRFLLAETSDDFCGKLTQSLISRASSNDLGQDQPPVDDSASVSRTTAATDTQLPTESGVFYIDVSGTPANSNASVSESIEVNANIECVDTDNLGVDDDKARVDTDKDSMDTDKMDTGYNNALDHGIVDQPCDNSNPVVSTTSLQDPCLTPKADVLPAVREDATRIPVGRAKHEPDDLINATAASQMLDVVRIEGEANENGSESSSVIMIQDDYMGSCLRDDGKSEHQKDVDTENSITGSHLDQVVTDANLRGNVRNDKNDDHASAILELSQSPSLGKTSPPSTGEKSLQPNRSNDRKRKNDDDANESIITPDTTVKEIGDLLSRDESLEVIIRSRKPNSPEIKITVPSSELSHGSQSRDSDWCGSSVKSGSLFTSPPSRKKLLTDYFSPTIDLRTPQKDHPALSSTPMPTAASSLPDAEPSPPTGVALSQVLNSELEIYTVKSPLPHATRSQLKQSPVITHQHVTRSKQSRITNDAEDNLQLSPSQEHATTKPHQSSQKQSVIAVGPRATRSKRQQSTSQKQNMTPIRQNSQVTSEAENTTPVYVQSPTHPQVKKAKHHHSPIEARTTRSKDKQKLSTIVSKEQDSKYSVQQHVVTSTQQNLNRERGTSIVQNISPGKSLENASSLSLSTSQNEPVNSQNHRSSQNNVTSEVLDTSVAAPPQKATSRDTHSLPDSSTPISLYKKLHPSKVQPVVKAVDCVLDSPTLRISRNKRHLKTLVPLDEVSVIQSDEEFTEICLRDHNLRRRSVGEAAMKRTSTGAVSKLGRRKSTGITQNKQQKSAAIVSKTPRKGTPTRLICDEKNSLSPKVAPTPKRLTRGPSEKSAYNLRRRKIVES